MRWLNRSLMDSPYSYALCTSEKEYRKELKRLKIPNANQEPFLKHNSANATTHFFESSDAHDRCCIVCLGSTEGVAKIQVYALLVHEAVHIWQAVRDSLGERYPGHEQEAYAVQGIAQSLMYAYKDGRK